MKKSSSKKSRKSGGRKPETKVAWLGDKGAFVAKATSIDRSIPSGAMLAKPYER